MPSFPGLFITIQAVSRYVVLSKVFLCPSLPCWKFRNVTVGVEEITPGRVYPIVSLLCETKSIISINYGYLFLRLQKELSWFLELRLGPEVRDGCSGME